MGGKSSGILATALLTFSVRSAGLRFSRSLGLPESSSGFHIEDKLRMCQSVRYWTLVLQDEGLPTGTPRASSGTSAAIFPGSLKASPV